jgi:hypothetical protein
MKCSDVRINEWVFTAIKLEQKEHIKETVHPYSQRYFLNKFRFFRVEGFPQGDGPFQLGKSPG